MKIQVTTTDGTPTLCEGTGWVVDDYGHLHIRAANGGNSAAFAATHWVSVSKPS